MSIIPVLVCAWFTAGFGFDEDGWTICEGDSLSLLQVRAKTAGGRSQVDANAKNSNAFRQRLERRWRLRKNARLNEVLVVPKLKLIFCFVPKNACSQFNRLVNRLNGIDDGDICTDRDPNYKSAMLNFTADDFEEALNDPRWTKAVFLRDPLERLVSAFRSKCEDPRECGGDCPIPSFGNSEKFHSFSKVAHDMEFISNAHFLPQSSLCGGLGDTIGAYDYIGHISQDFKSEHRQVTEMLHLLAKRQLDSGASPLDAHAGDEKNSPPLADKPSLATLSQHIHPTEAQLPLLASEYFPETGPDHRDPHVHLTGNVSEYFANIFSLQKALRYYEDDYNLLPGLRRPDWARRVSLYYDTAGSLQPRPKWLNEAQ